MKSWKRPSRGWTNNQPTVSDDAKSPLRDIIKGLFQKSTLPSKNPIDCRTGHDKITSTFFLNNPVWILVRGAALSLIGNLIFKTLKQ